MKFPKVYIIAFNYNGWADTKEIGKLFDMDYTSVSVSAKRFEEKMGRDKKISEIVDRAMEKIRKEKR